MTVLDIDLDNVKSVEDEDVQAIDDHADAPEATAPAPDGQKKKGKTPVTA